MRTVPDGGTTLNAVHSVQGQVRLKQLDLTACIAMVPVVPLLLQVLWARRHLQASIVPSLPASHCTGTLAVPYDYILCCKLWMRMVMMSHQLVAWRAGDGCL